MQIAIATTAIDNVPFVGTEHGLIPSLKRHGIEAEFVIWDDECIDWSRYDAVLVRSIWNYHEKPQIFLDWLSSLESQSIPVANKPDILRWNMDKRYLRDLAVHNIPTLPTVWVEDSCKTSLLTILETNTWQEAVIKPTVSNSAINTWRTDIASAKSDQARFEALMQRKRVMVQQFAPQIATGEYSFLFFGGTFSHLVLKKPAENAYFVQAEYGGTTTLIDAIEAHYVEQAEDILSAATQIIGHTPTYARVDVIDDGGTLVLMELELIEPELFLLTDDITQRCADAVASDLYANDLHL
ncbi:MAG: hypothetical protein CL607_24845 [Anaerolineaceae bacterium]|nr:hypothetical protein [Anaerolineaceae bacterium]